MNKHEYLYNALMYDTYYFHSAWNCLIFVIREIREVSVIAQCCGIMFPSEGFSDRMDSEERKEKVI